MDTSCFTQVTQAVYLRELLFVLAIENISRAQKLKDPICNEDTCAAKIRMAQARKNTSIKILITNKVTDQTYITKKELFRLQQENNSLKKHKDQKETVRNCDLE